MDIELAVRVTTKGFLASHPTRLDRRICVQLSDGRACDKGMEPGDGTVAAMVPTCMPCVSSASLSTRTPNMCQCFFFLLFIITVSAMLFYPLDLHPTTHTFRFYFNLFLGRRTRNSVLIQYHRYKKIHKRKTIQSGQMAHAPSDRRRRRSSHRTTPTGRLRPPCTSPTAKPPEGEEAGDLPA